jgi:hypothetical protein
MKWSCLTTALLLFALSANGQESNREYTRAVKLYNLIDWESYSTSWTDSDTNFFNPTQSSLRIFHPTIAYQWQSKKGNYHELELITLRLSHEEHILKSASPSSGASSQIAESMIVSQFGFSVRYEYQMDLIAKDKKPWDFSLGLGINPYYFYQISRSELTTIFPTSLSTFGTRLFAVPRFSWHLSPRFFLDVNVPICLGEYRHQYHYDENPAFAISERGRRQVDFSTLPALFSGRIGIGFKL